MSYAARQLSLLLSKYHGSRHMHNNCWCWELALLSRICMRKEPQQEGSCGSCLLPLYGRPLRVFQEAVLQALSTWR